MKIGIITFHCSYNFGSALQVYALQRIAMGEGHDVSVIDYRGQDFKQYRLMRIARPKTMLKLITNYQKNVFRKKNFEGFWRKHLSLTPSTYTYRNEIRLTELQADFDCFICGSDQIWNLDCTKGAVGPYFLEFAGAKRRIAYAPSLGHVSFRSENFDRQRIRSLLERFEAISVRERDTVAMFQPLSPVPIEVVVDPTLLLCGDDWREISTHRLLERPYLFLYILEHSEELIESASLLAEESGLPILYVHERNLPFTFEAHNLYGVGPEEFISLIDGARAVLTNSFHATAFSLMLGTPFRTFRTKNSFVRMQELLTKLQMGDALSDEVDCRMPESFDEGVMTARIESLRQESLTFLRDALRVTHE